MFVDEPDDELELDELGVVVVFVGVGVDVDVLDGSGVSVLVGVGAGVLVDVEVGAGGVVVELLAEVGAALDELDEEDGASVGRCMSRFAAVVLPVRWASSAFAAAAAAEVFESCEAASALLRRPS
ncbi:hypothetical protein [Catenulispora sp. GP43]|uniref:hypothetical protein n=1 Tax=Catenulispora sp. GP43 TaxID=3156263 RepID=UPI0035158080